MGIGRIARVGRVPGVGSPAPAPAYVSSIIFSDGATLRVLFNRRVTGGDSGDEGFALTGLSGGATTLTCNGSSDFGFGLEFTISRTVTSGETGGVLAYVPGDIVSASGTPLPAFSGVSVTNNSTVP